MKTTLISILLLLVFILQFSCISGKQQNGGPTPLPWEQPRTEMKKILITVFGYGFSSGKSQMGTEMAAKNDATASLAEQIKGSFFSFSLSNDKAEFFSSTGEIAFSGIRVDSKNTIRKNNNYQSMVTARCETEIEIPVGNDLIKRSYKDTGGDVLLTIQSLKAKAVYDSVKETYNTNTLKDIAGRIFLTFLKVVLLNNEIEVTAEFSIAFY